MWLYAERFPFSVFRCPAYVRAFVVVISIITLASCGFSPLYSKKAETAQLAEFLNSMEINPSGDDRLAQQIRTKIEDLLHNSGTQKNFRLNFTAKYLKIPVGISPDGQVSRYNIAMQSDYTVNRISDGKEFDSGTINVRVSYNASISADYATFISERDAIGRGATELAESMRSRLITTFYGQPKDENGN